MDSVFTASLTALFGVLVFVTGQAAIKFLVEPIQEQRRIIGEIAFNLTYLGNIGYVGDLPASMFHEDPSNASITIRRLAGQLRSTLFTIPLYDKLAQVGWVRNRKAILEASANLIGWSNSLSHGDPNAFREEIAVALNLRLNPDAPLLPR